MRGFLFILLVAAATAATAQSRGNDPKETVRPPTEADRAPPEPVRPSRAPVFSAPFRAIPKEAVHGKIRHVQEMVVEIDGKQQFLSPGAQIRDARNNLILPIGLPGAESERADAKYQRDGTGSIHRVWLLSEREIAALPPPPYPK